MADKVTVLTAGSWGTALAIVLAENGHDTVIWMRNEHQAEEINTKHTNEHFLPQVKLPANLKATTDMGAAVTDAKAVVIAAPSAAMRDVTRQAAPFIRTDTLIVHATKGFENHTWKRMSQVIAEQFQYDEDEICVLSGPSHAEEVSKRCPTTVVVASRNLAAAEAVQDLFINSYFRVYTNPDLLGVEISGALKNIIALGAGMSDGLQFGDNAKAALITRGLAEITRLGVKLGASPMTFAGLSGVGDLIVTCTSKHSRNWRAGHRIAQGTSVNDVLAEMGMVVEGVQTTKAAYQLAQEHQVTMPITGELYAVLFAGKSPRKAVEDLMGRGRTHELEEIVRHMQ